MANPWFRLYSKIMTDPLIEFLSFEDQRHFVWLLCLKNDGVLDKDYPSSEMLDRVIARKLGLQNEAFDNAKIRLLETGLIDTKWQPLKWNDLQFISDSSAKRTAEYRARLRKKEPVTSQERHNKVTVTAQDTDTEQIQSKKKKKFKPPVHTEINEYCKERKITVDAERFINHYDSNGWMVGKNKMKDWKATVRNWGKPDMKSQPSGLVRKELSHGE